MPEREAAVVQIPQGGAQPDAAPVHHKGSIYTSEGQLPDEFVRLIQELEKQLEMPIWMLIQSGEDKEWDEVSDTIYRAFHGSKHLIEQKKPVGLILHSPGGQAEAAYKILRLFQRRTNKLTTIVPCYAKSATTIMAIGGNRIVMGREAELGPLDVQLWDADNYEYDSALNAVQSLERLNAYALTALDQVMMLLVGRTGRRPDALLPLACTYATSMIRPLVEKIDSTNLTRKSRDLKVAEDYAVRLMKAAGYSFAEAKRIAGALVERYSTHGFVIDRWEVKTLEGTGSGAFGLGLKVDEPQESVEGLFDSLLPHLEKLTVIGRLEEMKA